MFCKYLYFLKSSIFDQLCRYYPAVPVNGLNSRRLAQADPHAAQYVQEKGPVRPAQLTQTIRHQKPIQLSKTVDNSMQ